MQAGKTPTTPTVSSIIAGVQCQEAVKLLHGLETIKGRGWVFDGMSADTYQIEFQRKPGCYSHETLGEIVSLDLKATTTTAGRLLAEARARLGPAAHLELGRDVLERLVCPKCGQEEPVFSSLGRVGAERAFCPVCPGVRRDVITFYRINGNEAFIDRPLSEIGVPPFDIVIVREGDRAIGLELAGDAPEALGSLSDSEALQWE
jgi:adenylyltransferase/sulfurtransferase